MSADHTSHNEVWVDAEVHLLPPEWCCSDYRPPVHETIMRDVIYNHPEREAALSHATVDALLLEMDNTGIEWAVIMGLPWQEPEMNWQNNAYISKAVQKYPEHLIGLGVLPPPEKENLGDSVRRIAQEYGLQGVKVIPSWQGYHLNDKVFEPVIEEIIAENLVLMPHTDHVFMNPGKADTAYSLYDVARRYPELKILAPHLGGLLCLYNLHEPIKSALHNILFITTVPTTMLMVKFAIESIGAEHIAFGTDFPFNPSHDQRTVREAFEALPIPEYEKHAIAGQNVLRFLGYDA